MSPLNHLLSEQNNPTSVNLFSCGNPVTPLLSKWLYTALSPTQKYLPSHKLTKTGHYSQCGLSSFVALCNFSEHLVKGQHLYCIHQSMWIQGNIILSSCLHECFHWCSPWTSARPSPISPAASVSETYGQAVAWGEPAGMWMVANNLGSWFCWFLFFFLETLGMQTCGVWPERTD